MAHKKACLICRAKNVAAQFEKTRLVSQLSAFKFLVRKINAAMEDPKAFDGKACIHAEWDDIKIAREVILLNSMAETRQGVKVLL